MCTLSYVLNFRPDDRPLQEDKQLLEDRLAEAEHRRRQAHAASGVSVGGDSGDAGVVDIAAASGSRGSSLQHGPSVITLQCC